MAKLLITRPRPDNLRTAQNLREVGIGTVLIPFLTFQTLDVQLPKPQKFAGLALTSANALRALKELGQVGQWISLPLFAIGEKTAEAARRAGFLSITMAQNSLASLTETIRENLPSGPLLYPAALHRSGNLGNDLNRAGIEVETLPVYEMKAKTHLSAQELALLAEDDLDGALFYSRRTAKVFIAACNNARLNSPNPLGLKDRLSVLCLSQNIADTFREAGFGSIHIADAPNERAMTALALSFAAAGRK